MQGGGKKKEEEKKGGHYYGFDSSGLEKAAMVSFLFEKSHTYFSNDHNMNNSSIYYRRQNTWIHQTMPKKHST